MNLDVLKKLSFGVEIEGYFSASLHNKVKGNWHTDGSVSNHFACTLPNPLRCSGDSCDACDGDGFIHAVCDCQRDRLACARNHLHRISCYRLKCEDDRSVHSHLCAECDGTGYGHVDVDNEDYSSCEISSEYSSPVINEFDELLALLNEFNPLDTTEKPPTHSWDYSAGLHLHIGLKEKDNTNRWKLWSVVSNLTLMRKLRGLAIDQGCEHLKHRLQDHSNTYYQMPTSPKNLINDTMNGEKYRFCRFHPRMGTLEFRFLVPCEHKQQNIIKLVGALTDYIASDETQTFTSEVDISSPPRIQSMHVNYKLRDSQTVKRYNSIYQMAFDHYAKMFPAEFNDLPKSDQYYITSKARMRAEMDTSANSIAADSGTVTIATNLNDVYHRYIEQ